MKLVFCLAIGVVFNLAFVSSKAVVSPSLLRLDSDESVKVTIWVSDANAFDKIASQVGEDNIVEKFYPEAIVVKLNALQINEFANKDEVAILEPALDFSISMTDAASITKASTVWNWNYKGAYLTGTGQTIAIVDTGIDFSHPDLIGKNIAGVEFDCYNFADCQGSTSVTDLNGHGTHVAGIAGASGGIKGIAPGVNLIALKMFNGSSGTFTSTVPIVRSIDKAVQLAERYNISVISMSIASNGWFTGACDVNFPTIANAINAAAAKNISVVISTGNNYKTDRISVPSCISNAIPVAASNKSDSFATYSNVNSFVKLVAPGTEIVSTKRGGGYIAMSGTSMAAPMVAGSFAIANQKIALDGKSKSMTPKQIETLLALNGDDLKDNSQLKRINLERTFWKLNVFLTKLSKTSVNSATAGNCGLELC